MDRLSVIFTLATAGINLIIALINFAIIILSLIKDKGKNKKNQHRSRR